MVSAWLAIDDVDIDNSAMQVIPRSHHHAQLRFRDSTATENNVLYQTVDNAADYGEHIPTPQGAAAADPVREASLSPHRGR